MPLWYMDIQEVWHLTARRGDATVVPCLADMFVLDDSPYKAERLPAKGKVCITCIRCWDRANMFLCGDE